MGHISIHLFSLLIRCLFMSFCPPSALSPFLSTPFPNQVSNQGFQLEARLSLPLLLVWGIMFWVLDQSQLKKNICATFCYLVYVIFIAGLGGWKNAIVTPGPIKHWLDFLMDLGNGKRKKKTSHSGQTCRAEWNIDFLLYCEENTPRPTPWFSSIIRTPFKQACMLPNASSLISMVTTHPDTTVSAIP